MGVSIFTLGAVGIGAMGVLLVLHIIASRLGWALELHKLKIEAHRLRADYSKRMVEMRGWDDQEPLDVGSSDDDEVDRREAA